MRMGSPMWSGKKVTPMELFDASLDQLRYRVEQLDEYARAVEMDLESLDQLRAEVFPEGMNLDRDWDDYHLVRNEFDRRAAEEFDLGQ
jgi:hypothetical protein